MDQYLSTVIIALITGVFSIITVIIQKKQDKVIRKIDEQAVFIDREKTLKQRLSKKEKEQESLMHDVIILILDTNINILLNTNNSNIPIDDICKKSEVLKEQLENITNEIEDINNEYSLVLDITNEVQKEFNQSQNNKK